MPLSIKEWAEKFNISEEQIKKWVNLYNMLKSDGLIFTSEALSESRKIIFNKIKCKYLYVSKNFKFGNKRKGNIATLKKFQKNYSYKNMITNPFKKNNKIISSTLIRKKIRQGKIIEVNKLLNRNWCVEGRVIKGQKRGRRIGFPTCNLNMGNYVIPRLGVYSVKVKTNSFNKNDKINNKNIKVVNLEILKVKTWFGDKDLFS